MVRAGSLASLVSCALVGCGGSGTSPTPDAADPLVEVHVPFAAELGGAAFQCGKTVDGVGTPAARFAVTDLRFYVTDVALVTADGVATKILLETDPFQRGRVALLDFENGCGSDGTPALHTTITGWAPDRAYQRVQFTLGVPVELNHLDLAAATSPLDVTGMYWTWLYGYKFLKVDGAVPPAAVGGSPTPYFVHLGSSGCPGANDGAPPTSTCANPNRATYDLAFDPKTSTIVADLGALLSPINLTVNTMDTAPGCMSEPGDPECAALLPRLGVPSTTGQALFRVK